MVFGKSKKRHVHHPDNLAGWLFIMPVVLGILFFTAWPMISSLYFSFTKYDVLTSPAWIGFKNYINIFTRDETFYKSLWVTTKYTLIVVPVTMLLGFLLALALNQKLRGMKFFRMLFYIPVIVPMAVSSLLWVEMYDVEYGIANRILGAVGVGPQPWLTDSRTALYSLMLMTLWGIGGGMIIWLASLQAIPESMYESARIEGASWFRKTWHITIPMCSPVIFYNLVMGIIGTFQTFGQSFIMTNGGPDESTMFYVLKVYQSGFLGLKMGYASALSWVLFVIIMGLTVVLFKSSKWVYYGEDAA